MGVITLATISEYWKSVRDWVKGMDTDSSPKVTVTNLPVTQDVKITSSSTITTDETRLPAALGSNGGVKTEIVNTPAVSVSGTVTVGTHGVTLTQLPSELDTDALKISLTKAIDVNTILKTDSIGLAKGTQFPSTLQNDALKVAVTEAARPIAHTQEEVIRKTLVANTVGTFLFSSACEEYEIMNLGDDDIYIDVATDPTVDGENSILIPAGIGYTLKIKVSDIRAISTGTPKVQIIGVR